MVPVDMINNLIISAGWMTGVNPPTSQPIIYQYTSGTVNPITWIELCELTTSNWKDLKSLALVCLGGRG